MVNAERSAAPPVLDPCAEERVQVIGQVQSHGVLFALSEPDLVVRQVSANVGSYFEAPSERVLGCSFERILGAEQFARFQFHLGTGDLLEAAPLRLRIGTAGEMDCFVHRHDGVLIAEFERTAGAEPPEPLNLTTHARIPLMRMQRALNIMELSQVTATEIQRLSGFDRVLVYRFDAEWSGEVVAEAAKPSPISYLGLRFPAGDIPAPVRRLFLINPIRGIADVDDVAVPIIPVVSPLTGRPLDLTRSILRSAAMVHLEYLRNMGVQASLTISIIVNKRLWGMITCHNGTPLRLHSSTRSVCELVANIFNSGLALLIDNGALQSRLASRSRLNEYMNRLGDTVDLVDAAQLERPGLLELFAAEGLVCSIGGTVSYAGSAVEARLLLPIVGLLRNQALRGIASSNSLAALDPAAVQFAGQASGALYIGLAEAGEDYLLVLRRELVETVRWAGDAVKSAQTDEQGHLRPRASFAAWKETVRGRSRPWNELELESAAILRERLLRLREAQQLHKAEERVRYLASHDALTGLRNRHALSAMLDQYVKRASADHTSFAVLFIDLDGFKQFNDRLGHASGDEILKIVSKRIQSEVREGDVVGRLGGDEFIVILLGLSAEGASLRVARMSEAIAEPMVIDQQGPITITASIGLSSYPVDGSSADELVNRSDLAMYRVKRGGGNDFQPFAADDILPP